MSDLELWGGLECTVVRIGDRWRDQSRLSGHHDRDDDLDLFADIGFRAVRYPLLWERVAPDHPDEHDWSWTDGRLARLRALGIRPIAGLVHHGSGPHYTSLLDPGFAAKLGRYAGAVARRYPWIVDWTPVNEPLTTARFSALYGHWYPHRRDEGDFWTALVNQVDGVRQAMHAIREVTPGARLIQTDDLGRAYATEPLRHQAAFDNVRRWAGWDLLFGRVTPEHALWERLAAFGLGDRLRALADDPCPPDVVGVNHYLTSDRWLDHRLQRYPARTHGGNHHQRYVDVEAIRVLDPAPAGLAGALREAWERYRAPLAITEVHLGCTREEQLRWIGEAWDTAMALRDEGVDVRAATAWAVLGSCGWNTLLTADGVYEPGLYDLEAGRPRPTALAAMWRTLPRGDERHPVSRTPGWWRGPDRLLYPPVPRPARFERAAPALRTADAAPPLLVTGATGRLGRALAGACRNRGIHHVLTDRAELDLTDVRSVAAALERHRPWAVVNAAGWSDPSSAERHPEACRRLEEGAAALARLADARGVPTLHFSSALVFDGASGGPHAEDDAPKPAGVLGRAKAAMERAVLSLPGRHLMVRTGPLFDPDADRFAAEIVDALAAGRRFRATDDGLFSPVFLPSLVDAALDLSIDRVTGVRHLTHGEPVSPAEFARRLAAACGLDPALVDVVPGQARGPAARYAARSALRTTRGRPLAPLGDALGRFAEAWAHRLAAERRRAA